MEDLSQYIDLFKEEATEILQTLNDQLLALERDPAEKTVIEELFRAAHSLKGMAATMGFDDMAQLTHKMENLMEKVRKEEIEITTPIMNVLFSAADIVQVLLDQVGEENPSDKVDLEAITAALEQASTGSICFEDPKKKKKSKSPQAETKKDRSPDTDKVRMGSTVRVRLEHLDNLTNLVGELVISKARLDQLELTHETTEVSDTLDRIKAVLGDLQHEVMQLRLVPVGQVFNRFPRLVRDMAQELGKEVEFVLEGADIELDRAVLDEIGEPLVHLLRNAVGHGIETAEKREELGKPRCGRIRLTAQREKEGAVVEVSDDGGGIDPVKVKEAAVENGFISRNEAGLMSEEDVIQLVALPGFTSMKRATSLSGRGVGVDAVKAKIVGLGGALVVKSEPGKGASFIMKLPPSLAIIKALLVRVNGVSYAVPLKNVVEVVKIKRDELKSVGGQDVIRIHGEVVQVTHLSKLLSHGPAGNRRKETLPIVVTEVEGKKRGFAVDEISAQQDVVIKPLNPALQYISGLSGATILGDGKVALILDVRNMPAFTGGREKIHENAKVN